MSTCGNGVVDEPYEECDDGNLDDRNDDCRNDCTWRCVMDVQCADDEPCNGTEQCDLEQHLCLPGSPWANETRCSKLGMVGRCKAARCVPEECGNQVVDPGEECDDGNQSDNDECLIHCIENMCGDGFVLAGTEDCDDANMIDGDGCDWAWTGGDSDGIAMASFTGKFCLTISFSNINGTNAVKVYDGDSGTTTEIPFDDIELCHSEFP